LHRYPRIKALRTRLAVCLLTTLLPAVLLADSAVPRLTFAQLVDSIRADSDVTQTIKSYGGKEVEIRGFIIPAGPPDLSFFMLSRVSALGNYCCEVPVGQDETVYVFAEKEVKITYVESPGGVSPPGAPRSVREPLDSYGSRCSAVSMAEPPVGKERWIYST